MSMSDDDEQKKMVTIEAKKDIVFLISFFRLPQPFKIFLTPRYDYTSRRTCGYASAVVKIRGKKTDLTAARMNDVSVEEFLQKAILEYEKKRQ